VRVLDSLSLGARLNVQYTHAKLTNFLDLGTLCVVEQGLTPELCNDLVAFQATLAFD
jgi:hypothetical protein